MKLTAQQNAALSLLVTARANERNAKALAQLELATLIEERTLEAYNGTQNALRTCVAMGIPVSTIGREGLGTSDPATPRKRIAELNLESKRISTYLDGVKLEYTASYLADEKVVSITFDGYTHPKLGIPLYRTYTFSLPLDYGSNWQTSIGMYALHTPEVENGEWKEDQLSLQSLFSRGVVTAIEDAIRAVVPTWEPQRTQANPFADSTEE